MVKLILIPAAQTDWRAQSRLSGDSDLPLNEVGHRAAMAEAQDLAEFHPAAIRCGPEQATRQTASIIAHELRLRVRAVDELRELDLGHWEGLTTEDFQDRFGKVYRQWRQEPMSVEPPEGETITAAAARLIDGLRKVLKRHKGEAVALVLGQFAFTILRCELQGHSYEQFWDYIDGEECRQVFDVDETALTPPTHPNGSRGTSQDAPPSV